MTSLPERLDLAPDPTSVAAARAFVAGVLRGWGLHGAVETATLLTSELATNAVRHAGTRYAVVVCRTAGGVRVDVLDGGPHAPQLPADDPHADGGRGLQLVAGLASAWGATPAEDLRGYAKGVRFEVSEAAAATGTSTRARGAAAAGH